MQDASWCILGVHEGHTTKSCCPLRFTLLISRKSEKNLCLDHSLFVCQLYWCSSKPNNNKALRITFNSRKTVCTYSMALAAVNINKIIKVTSASSYVYFLLHPVDLITHCSIRWLSRCNLQHVGGMWQLQSRRVNLIGLRRQNNFLEFIMHLGLIKLPSFESFDHRSLVHTS